MLRLPGEHPVATVREALKIITPLLALAAAIAAGYIAWGQFELAESRLRIDQRPWVSLDGFSLEDASIDKDRQSWRIGFQIKNSGLTPAQSVAIGMKPTPDAKAFEQARRDACADAETSGVAFSVFPRDQIPWSLIVHADRNQLTVVDIRGVKFFPLAVVCIVYRSTLEQDLHHHHTPYALSLQIVEGIPLDTEIVKAGTKMKTVVRSTPLAAIGLAD